MIQDVVISAQAIRRHFSLQGIWQGMADFLIFLLTQGIISLFLRLLTQAQIVSNQRRQDSKGNLQIQWLCVQEKGRPIFTDFLPCFSVVQLKDSASLRKRLMQQQQIICLAAYSQCYLSLQSPPQLDITVGMQQVIFLLKLILGMSKFSGSANFYFFQLGFYSKKLL